MSNSEGLGQFTRRSNRRSNVEREVALRMNRVRCFFFLCFSSCASFLAHQTLIMLAANLKQRATHNPSELRQGGCLKETTKEGGRGPDFC